MCGVSQDLTNTFDNALVARSLGSKVAHCGECGACSNQNDMEIYYNTRNTLTKTATDCATKAFIGKEAVEKCY